MLGTKRETISFTMTLTLKELGKRVKVLTVNAMKIKLKFILVPTFKKNQYK